MHFTRRDFIKAFGAAAAIMGTGNVLLPQPAAAHQLLPSLCKIAGTRNLLYGTCSDTDLAKAQGYSTLVAQQCNLFAPQLGWHRTSPRPDNQLVWQDANVPFVLRSGMRLTGYHLVWHLNTPKWFSELPSADAAGKAILDHIRLMGARYGKTTYSWNVVNEALNPKEGGPQSLRRESPYLAKMGPEFIDFAFRAAHQAAPEVTRVYNDYGMEMDTADQEAKRTALLRLLDGLQKKGTPIDAVGLQSHLKPQYPFDAGRYRAFLREIASRRLKILITELDVFDAGFPAEIRARDRMVADVYSRFLNTALDERSVKAVTTWGLSDRYTWLGPRYDKAFARPDGLPQRPLAFGGDLQPKPAFYAVLNALSAAPPRELG